jgi:hypothetical protein
MRNHVIRDGVIQELLQGRGNGHGGSSTTMGNRHARRNSRRRLTMRAIAVTPTIRLSAGSDNANFGGTVSAAPGSI